MSRVEFPKLRVRVPEGRTVFTTVELDGKELPATRLWFDTGDADAKSGMVKVRLEFYADIDLEADVPLAVTNIERVHA